MDLIEREAAIEALRNHRILPLGDHPAYNRAMVDSEKIIRKLPSAQPTQTNAESTQKCVGSTQDCVSRQAAIDSLMNHLDADYLNGYSYLEELKHLPSAHPQRMRGRWTRHNDWEDEGYCGYTCSVCDMGVDVMYNYCPRCGADMREGHDEQID